MFLRLYGFCGLLIAFFSSCQLADSPNDEGEQIKQNYVAKHEKGIREFLYCAQQRQLRGIVRGNIKHTQVVAGLAGGCAEVQFIHKDIADNCKDNKAEKQHTGREKLLDIFAVASGNNQINAHHYQHRVPKHRMNRHGDEVGVQNCGGNQHNSKSTDDAIESQKLIAKLSCFSGGDQSSCNRHIDGDGAELIGEDLESVVIIEFPPKQLLENLAADQNRGKYSNHDPVALGAMFFAYSEADYDASDNHNTKPQNMEPAEHTGANITVVNIAPSHIDE